MAFFNSLWLGQVFIDARMYHAVFDKATDSPVTRPFLISIFKEASEASRTKLS